jgi:hypothetical protein
MTGWHGSMHPASSRATATGHVRREAVGGSLAGGQRRFL